MGAGMDDDQNYQASDNTQDSPQPTTNDGDANLDSIKTKAIEALTPIIDSLDNMDPERKFDICLTALRYTDNHHLAESALNAAMAIQEKGTKAEALVELINEINYLENA
jgi:hypothetical protein